MLASTLDVQQLWPLSSLFPLSAHAGIFLHTVQCLFSQTLSWGKSAQSCKHQRGSASSHQLQTGFRAFGALGSRESMKQGNGKNILKASSDLCLHSLKMRFELQPWPMNYELLAARVFSCQALHGPWSLWAARVLLRFCTCAHTSVWNCTTLCASTQSSLEGINNPGVLDIFPAGWSDRVF